MTSWCLTSLMIALLGADVSNAAGRTTVLEPKLVHLRSGSAREWSEFPEMAQGTHWEVPFSAALNDREFWSAFARGKDGAPPLASAVPAALTSIVGPTSRRAALKGVLTAGPARAARYAFAKVRKLFAKA